ncbi:MAG: hypothetical protein MUE41_07120 [Gemmatimonadaceae bacterium]|jgi:(2Fe-2S) ferredoxin|nr:hypothetical protein [Gemmatimonadaceae bacterium]
MSDRRRKLDRRAVARGILAADGAPDAPRPLVQHHVVLCTGRKCGGKKGKKAFRRLRACAAGLRRDGQPVLVTETPCLRLCEHGPLAVVYPDGTWYADITTDVVDRICDEHLREGRVVRSHCFATRPLPGRAPPDA